MLALHYTTTTNISRFCSTSVAAAALLHTMAMNLAAASFTSWAVCSSRTTTHHRLYHHHHHHNTHKPNISLLPHQHSIRTSTRTPVTAAVDSSVPLQKVDSFLLLVTIFVFLKMLFFWLAKKMFSTYISIFNFILEFKIICLCTQYDIVLRRSFGYLVPTHCWLLSYIELDICYLCYD